MRTRLMALVAIVAVAGAGLAACRGDDDGDTTTGAPGDPTSCGFNPPDEEFPAVDQPGVTDTEIRVGALVSEENILGRPFEKSVEGAEAYFCKVNEAGGVWGREVKVVSIRDDRMDPTQSLNQARALVEEDDVFAVLPVASPVFNFSANDYLGEAGVPTFGFNLTGWEGYPNLFGERGSFICPADCPLLAPSFVADQIEAANVAVLSYNVPQSADCAAGVRDTLEHYGHSVTHFDDGLLFGVQAQQLANNINAIRDAEVDLVVTCMDLNGTVTVAGALDQAAVDVSVYASEGYDPRALEDFGAVLEDFYFALPFWPFELAEENEGMAEFAAYMDARGEEVAELEFVGWSSAQLLVEGLERAGSEFTRASVVDAINEIEDWDADGTRDTIDWTIAHDGVSDDTCNAFVKVEGGEFTAVFGEPGSPYVCFPYGNSFDDVPAALDDPFYKP